MLYHLLIFLNTVDIVWDHFTFILELVHIEEDTHYIGLKVPHTCGAEVVMSQMDIALV